MVKLQLNLAVELDFSHVPASEIEMAIAKVEANMRNMASRAIEEGMINEDTQSEIEDYVIDVIEVANEPKQIATPRP